jgi:hypothetical protein
MFTMETRTKALLAGGIGTLAAVGMLTLMVYPFDYGVLESAVLVGLFVLVALYQTVLDDAFSST